MSTTVDLTSTPERQIVDLAGCNIPDARVLGRYRYQQSHQPLPPHRHRGMLEICFLQRGRQSYWVGGELHEIAGGDIFVTFPNELHSTGPDPEDRGILYWLILALPRAGDRFLGESGQGGRALLEKLRNLHRRRFRAAKSSQRLLEGMFRAAADARLPFDALRLRTLLVQFLISVIDAAEVAATPAPSPPIARVLAHIEKDFANLHIVEELAGVARLSVSRFKARFRAETGFPPAEYLIRAKITWARNLLQEGTTSVTDVAYNAGFSSSQHFATVFKRYTGQRPRDVLRRNIR